MLQKSIPFFLVLIIVVFMPTVFLNAGVIEELKSKIEVRSNEIQNLEEEIASYLKEIDSLDGEAHTLETALEKINVTEKKLNADVRLTEKRIERTKDRIDELREEITNKGKGIQNNSEVLAQVVRTMNELESRSFIEILFSYKTLSSFWDKVSSLEQFEASVSDHVTNLRILKRESEERHKELKREREQSVELKQQLLDKGRIVKANKEAKAKFLKETKNREKNYRNLLLDRKARKRALEEEINKFEAELRVEIDPNSLPKTGTGILSWPLKNIYITQYFGNTPFASKNPQVYNGAGHNGVDLRAPMGTVVQAAAGGVVMDTGNTDAPTQCPGASYGKWVLIRHYNNLATLYAHLSLRRVEPGQEVKAGDTIGYSGNTGYSTGPHLHFTVFAAQGVRVTEEYRSRVCGTILKLPLAPKNGYLNPLSYLQEVEQ